MGLKKTSTQLYILCLVLVLLAAFNFDDSKLCTVFGGGAVILSFYAQKLEKEGR